MRVLYVAGPYRDARGEWYIKRYWSDAYKEYHAWPLWSAVTNSSGITYRYLYWPMRPKLAWRHGAWRTWFRWHGIELVHREGDSPNIVLHSWTFHLGPLKVCFGPSCH